MSRRTLILIFGLAVIVTCIVEITGHYISGGERTFLSAERQASAVKAAAEDLAAEVT